MIDTLFSALPVKKSFSFLNLSSIFDLIKKKKISIFEIRISSITERFLEYLDRSASFDLRIAEEFLEIASRLLYTKAKMLLSLDKEVEEVEEISFDRFEKRERLNRMVKVLENFPMLDRDFFLREGKEPQEENSDILFFSKIFYELTKKREPSIKIPERKPKISEMIEFLRNLLESKGFFFWPERKRDRFENITLFLALLEMVKMKVALIFQKRMFGKILLKRR